MTTETELCYRPLDAASGQPIQLSMQRLNLSGRILPVGARLLVRHDFVSSAPGATEDPPR
ncbi:MAG: hypothetical protein M1541_07050 [Acidobacteria bacterium]|nr:hypothetical protein [Acidobacteriota bacterium]